MLVGYIVKGVTYAGYSLTGLYLFGTGIRYVKDYKEAVANDKG